MMIMERAINRIAERIVKTPRQKLLEAEERGSRCKRDAKAAAEAGQKGRAERLYAKSRYWLARYHNLSRPGSVVISAESTARDLGQRIRRLRQEGGLTQVELARKAGMRQSSISDIERGRAELDASTIIRVGQALGPLGRELLNVGTSPCEDSDPSNVTDIARTADGTSIGNEMGAAIR